MAQDRKPESRDKNRGDARSGRLRLGKMRENLDKLVKEGKVSKKDADARFEEAVNRYKKSLGDQDSRKAPKRKGGDKAQAKSKAKGGSDKAAAAREKIIEAVKAGKLSREDAGKKLRAMKAKDGQKKDAKGKAKGEAKGQERDGRARYEAARKELGEAVRSGKITREEAGKRWKAIEGRMKLGEDKKKHDRLVKEGKISQKDADTRFKESVEAYKKSLGGQDSRKAPRGKGGDKAPAKGKAKAKEKGGSDKAAAAREKIIEAVKAGKLSREEAGKKLRAMKAKDGQKKDAKVKDHGKGHD
ncbi:MAG: hypothetical protein CMJ97_08690, partial [Planctomycetes bacterium]|nr:hypothetical protein [Planctomycetota bacterium]